MRKLKKALSIFLVVLLILGHFSPAVVFADELGEADQQETQEIEETVSPDEPDPEIDNEAEVTNEVESTAISGENTTEEPMPQSEAGPPLAETPTPEPEIVPEISPSPTPEPSPAVVETGDALSVVEVENSINSTEVNSQVLYQTLNIFASGDIDLTTTPLAIAEAVFSQNNNAQVVNVLVIDNQNFAYLENNIVSFADTGGNTIEGAQEAVITTGDACSVVSLLNKINTTIVDSTIHIVTINIFGGVKGNIILPEFSSSSEDGGGGEVIQTENTAIVENKISSTAISGQNSITSTESASIETGIANSTVNLVNIVNTNLIGVVFYHLFINTFGTWTGDFLGWDDFGALTGSSSLSLNSVNPGSNGNGSCLSCSSDILLENEAYVTNSVSSITNTGGNSINGGEATIKTGNAYSAVSIINFVNTSIIRSFGFFGFFNIFGFLDGNIGGASFFATPPASEPESEPDELKPGPEGTGTTGQESGPSVREEGGLLEVSQYNNVGTHVFPGDTITFFVTVKNPGTGHVYDTKLRVGLVNNGLDMGGATFDLGDIDPGKGVKITTGLVLSKNAEPGEYIARAVVSSYVGPDNSLISASADSSFLIAGISPLVQEAKAAEEEKILGAVSEERPKDENILPYALLFLLSSLWLVNKSRKMRKIIKTS